MGAGITEATGNDLRYLFELEQDINQQMPEIRTKEALEKCKADMEAYIEIAVGYMTYPEFFDAVRTAVNREIEQRFSKIS